MKLKVLPNDMQKALEFHERMVKRGNPLGRREKFDLFEYYKDHPVVFNRVGYYLTPTDCWMEFRLNDGTFKAINYDRHSFRWSLATAIAKDNPIPDKDWEMIKCLIQRKLLRWEERYIKESERRQFRRTEVDAKKWGLGVRKRMESKIEQRKAEQKLKAETSDNKPELRKVCEKCFETLPFDVTVLEGIRTLERQKELFAAKKSKTMNSKHLTGDAVDLAPYPIDWNNKDRFHQLARHMIKAGKDVGVFVVWGGTWTGDADDKAANFYDGPHFQLV